jgi:hypothetical protein
MSDSGSMNELGNLVDLKEEVWRCKDQILESPNNTPVLKSIFSAKPKRCAINGRKFINTGELV